MRYNVGQQTDALIAEKVMGLDPWPDTEDAFKPSTELLNRSPKLIAPQPYTTSMNAAWQIVDKLIAEGYDVALFSTTGMPRHKGRWACAVVRGDRGAKAHADTAPLAICRAVLAMLGGKEQL